MAEDEQIIKRKLILDGHGTGDERRLNTLMKSISKLILTNFDDPKESSSLFDNILAQIAQCEYSRRRSELLKQRTNNQILQFQKFRLEMEKRMENVTSVINQTKAALIRVQSQKKNRIDYDLLANVILTEPSKTETGGKICQLQEDIDKYQRECQMLTERFDFYRKQFHVLMTSANEIKGLLEEPQPEN